MIATIITCFESNEPRVSLVRDSFLNLNYKVNVITTNYSHMNKEFRKSIPNEYTSIDTKPYYKNLSVKRMISHADFAKKAFNMVEGQLPDVIWVCAPANSLIKEANIYKKKHPLVKMIIDIIDMWPESLPLKAFKNCLPLQEWKRSRSTNLICADKLVSECDFYQNILKNEYQNNIETIYWGKNEETPIPFYSANTNEVHLAYLGSINNIIDIEGIKKLVSNINEKVTLHIIGDGEKKEQLLSSLKTVCNVKYYGVIRDEKQKSRIFSQCHAGINMYKKNLFIGLTVKCIDYFSAGLPIINNIPSDTWKMVEEENLGINIEKNSGINVEELFELRKDYKRIHSFYLNTFSKEAIINKMEKVISEVVL